MRAAVYDNIRRRMPANLRQIVRSNSWIMSAISRAFGSSIYSRSYYEQVEQSERHSVTVIATWIDRVLGPRSVVDIGCGPGHLIEALHSSGIQVLGLDYSLAAKESVARKGLPFQTFDLTTPGLVPGAPWDLVVCCEVAEHLEARHADLFVQLLAGASDTVFLTAAEVGQGGLNHVNEQPNSYWITKFAGSGFSLDEDMTTQARSVFAEHKVVHYLAKPMLFRRG